MYNNQSVVLFVVVVAVVVFLCFLFVYWQVVAKKTLKGMNVEKY